MLTPMMRDPVMDLIYSWIVYLRLVSSTQHRNEIIYMDEI